jgi:putative thioredoxin
MAIDVTDFSTEVVEASKHTPILVDFWAPWCGPCRTLGPALERLDAEAGGAWKLAKVNTDAFPELSSQYQIRGIPAVKLFIDGSVVDEFTGALPEHAVRQWLEKALPSEAKKLLVQAEDLLIAGDKNGAVDFLHRVVADEPANAAASALLAGALVFEQPERALELAATGMSGEPRHVQLCEAVRTLVRATADGTEALPDEPGRSEAEAVIGFLADGKFDEAVRSILALLQVNRLFSDDWGRRVGVALFTILGPEHPVTREHRRTFDMWLY